MTNELYADPKLDEFKTESPLRAFSEYDTCGPYLIAKGFRPSLKHLTRYLAAMENKEGWRLLQILEADTGVPTMVFRSRNRMDTPISLGWATDDSTGKLTEITVHYNGEDVRLVPDYRDGDIFVVEYLNNDSQTVVRSPVERWPQWAQELAGYRPGDPDASAAEAVEKIEKAEAMDWTITVKGFNSEDVPWNRVQWRGNPEDLMDHLRVGDRTAARVFLKNEESYRNMTEFYQRASVASMLRLIDYLDAWDDVSLAEIISDEELYKVIGRVNTKARYHCRSEVTSGSAIVQNPADVLESHAKQVADELGIDVCRDSFAIAREYLSERVAGRVEDLPPEVVDDIKNTDISHLADDPVNPKHYDGRACADIGERLSANGYQILKYCWRLGKKDDPCQELGKALWYLDSEMAFIGTRGVPNRVQTNFRGLKDPSRFLQDRLSDQPQFTKSVAAALWNGYDARDLDILKMFIAEHKTTLDCGHGLAI